MNELRDLLRRYQQPNFKDKKDLSLSKSVLNITQVNIRYGIKAMSRLAIQASQSDEYLEGDAKDDLYSLGFFLNTLMDIQQFAHEQEDDIDNKLELVEKRK